MTAIANRPRAISSHGDIEIAPIALLSADDLIILDCSDDFAAGLGKTRQDLIGKPLGDFVPEAEAVRAQTGSARQQTFAVQTQVIPLKRELTSGGSGQIIIIRVLTATDPVTVAYVSSGVQPQLLWETAALLSSALEATANAVVITDPRGEVEWANRAFVELTGYPLAECRGQQVGELLKSGVHDKAYYQSLWQTIQSGQIWHGEITNKRKDGSLYDEEMTITPLRDANGVIKHFVAIKSDVTARKWAARRLAEETARRRVLVEQSRDGIVILDADGAVFEANQSFAAMLGYELAEIQHLHVWDWDTQWSRGQLLEMLAVVGSAGDHFETCHRRKDGSICEVEISTNGVEIQGQKLVLCICRDISERKRAAAELQHKSDQLELALQVARMGIWQHDIEAGKATTLYGHGPISSLPAALRPNDLESFLALVHREDRARLHQVFMDSVACGQDYEVEFRLCPPAGGENWTLSRGHFIKDPSGELKGLIGVDLDISERKAAEESKLVALARQEQLSKLHQALLNPGPLVEKLHLITEQVVAIFDAYFCRIWYSAPGDLCDSGCVHAATKSGPHVCRYREQCLRLVASSGRNTHVDGTMHRRVPFGAYKIGVLATGTERRLVTNDVESDPRIHNHEWARSHGLVAFAGFQLRPPGGDSLGVLALFSKRKITPEDEAQLDALSSATAQVIRAARAEEALRISEERYRTVADHTFDWEYWITAERKLAYCSPSCERITGYSSTEFAADPSLLKRIVHPDDLASWRDHSTDLQQGDGALDFRIITKGEETRWIAHVCTPVYTADGRFLGRRAGNSDVTDRRRIEVEKAMIQHQYLQAQKMEALGLLAGGIAHDFNNLLTAIQGNALLARERLGESAASSLELETIVNTCKRGSKIVKGLLTYARRTEQEPTIVDLATAIPEMADLLTYFAGKNSKLEIQTPAQSCRVLIDPAALDQIISNLVINARDAIAHDHGEIRVLVELEQSVNSDMKKAVVVSVSDNGCGMAPEELQRIFDPFYTTKDFGKGTGLGLAIVRGAVESAGGTISVDSRLGVGTTMRVRLPVVPV